MDSLSIIAPVSRRCISTGSRIKSIICSANVGTYRLKLSNGWRKAEKDLSHANETKRRTKAMNRRMIGACLLGQFLAVTLLISATESKAQKTPAAPKPPSSETLAALQSVSADLVKAGSITGEYRGGVF